MEIIVKVPPFTPGDSVVYLAGNVRELGMWKPDGLRLRRQRDGTWLGRVHVGPGERVEFKVTLGRWDRVEKDPWGGDVGNHVVMDGDEERGSGAGDGSEGRRVVEVKNWGQAVAVPSTVVGELHVHDRFYSPTLGNMRNVYVWLPPGYSADRGERGGYPVVYMHDGQNLFDAARAAFGVEWQVDECATDLIGRGEVEPFIVVGIENTNDRFGEYTPTAAGGVGGRGSLYGRFLTGEVMPFIESHYRVRGRGGSAAGGEGGGGKNHVAGSSLGGLISLFLLREYPQLFEGCAALSPSLWWDGESLLKEAERDGQWARGKRIWVDMGTAEAGWGQESAHVERVRRLQRTLERQVGGVSGKGMVVCEIVEGAVHNEAAWAARLPQVFRHLLGGVGSR